MKYKFILFIALLSIGLAFEGCNEIPKSYELNGEVYSPLFNGKTIYLSKVEDEELTNIDSTIVKDNKFFFEGVQDDPTICYLRFKRDKSYPQYDPVIFVLENGQISVHIVKFGSKAVGTALNDSLLSFFDSIDKFQKHLFLIDSEYKKMIADSTINAEKEQQIYEKYNSVERANIEYVKKIIGQNLNNVLGAYVLNLNRNRLSNEEVESILQKAGTIFKKQPDIRLISERLRRLDKTSIGQMFKDFNSQDIRGKKRSLSEYAGQGKFLIIGFWSSTCPSSQIEMGKLIDLYKEYRYKGVDIIEVSLDTDSSSWVKSVEQNNLASLHFSDLKGWNGEAVNIYEINRIPYILLLNPDGSIAARETDSNVLKMKMQKLFD